MMMMDVCYTSTFHTWCGGLSANLECRSESDFARLKICCTRLAEIEDAKNRQKSPSGHHHTTLSGYIFATIRHVGLSTIGKKTC